MCVGRLTRFMISRTVASSSLVQHVNPQRTSGRVLGMPTVKDQPVIINGQVVSRPTIVATQTYNHWLMDSREALSFLGH